MPNNLAQASETPHGEHVLHRIAWLTLVFGLAAAVVAASEHRTDWAKGLVCGTVLGWLNFRWLKRGVLAMVNAADTQSVLPENDVNPRKNEQKTGSAAGTYALALFRYTLIGIGVYVIFTYLHVPLTSIALGLCALGAATIAASVWEVLRPAP